MQQLDWNCPLVFDRVLKEYAVELTDSLFYESFSVTSSAVRGHVPGALPPSLPDCWWVQFCAYQEQASAAMSS